MKSSLRLISLDIWAYLFSRPSITKFNRFLFQMSLRSLGILNYRYATLAGENRAFKRVTFQNVHPIIFDVGANVGKWSSFVFRLYPNATIFAFEPHPKNFKKLSAVSNTSLFKPQNYAVSDRNGKMSLFDFDTHGSTHASLEACVLTDLHHHETPHSIEVEVVNLDSFCLNKNIHHIDFLKIDVEGFELEVLNGVKSLLNKRQVDYIQFEFNEMNAIRRVLFKDFWEMLSENFKIYRILTHGLLEIKEYNPLHCEIFAFQNILAVRRDLPSL